MKSINNITIHKIARFFFFLLVTLVSILFTSCSCEKVNAFTKIDNLNKLSEIFGNFLTPLFALIGILVAIPILRKKLIENHITTKLNEIQSANTEIQSYNQQLLDKYLPQTYSNEYLNKQDIENILSDLQQGFSIAQKASGDITTIMFYLKMTIQNIIKNFDTYTKSHFFITRSFLGFIIESLELSNFYASQVVQIPKSSATTQSPIITKTLHNFVTHSTISKYKHFNMGVINDPNSTHFTFFSDFANKTNCSALLRSAFQIYWSPNAIAKLLYLRKLYAPSVISMEVPDGYDPFLGRESYDMFLIGFSTSNRLSNDPNAPTKIVKLIYSNPDDVSRFVSGLTVDNKITKQFKDKWLPDTGFQLTKTESMSHTILETVELTFDRAYLEKMFECNKRKIKRKLKNILQDK